MLRKALPIVVIFAFIVVASEPAVALSASDLDLSDFPDGTEVIEILENDRGEPLVLCARPESTRVDWKDSETRTKLVKVPLEHPARNQSRVAGQGVDWVWVRMEIPGPKHRDSYTIEEIDCTNSCPQGGPSDEECVDDPDAPCPVCVARD